MIDLQAAKVLALKGIENYQKGESAEFGERNGICHGETGRNRAQRLKETLLAANTNEKILAALLAVFTIEPKPSCFFSNPFRNVGRSSKLAGLIADQFMTGGYRFDASILSRNTFSKPIKSTVFSDDVRLEAIKSKKSYVESGSGISFLKYFDKTKAVRHLLNEALNNEFQANKTSIIKSASELRTAFEKPEVKPTASKKFNLMHHFR